MTTHPTPRADRVPRARREAGNGIGLLLALLVCLGSADATRAAPNTPEGLTLPASKDAVRIAAGGQAKLAITISPQASESTRKVAAELAGYLKTMTGAEFAVHQGTQAQGITLGTLGEFPDASLNDALAIRDTYEGREAYAIRTDRDRIRLLARTELGISHAAYRFLELLGCRWFFQGPAWEVVPASPDLSFHLNETSRPDILSRIIWFGRTTQAWEKGDPDANAAFARWARGNRMGESLKVSIHHQWHAIPKEFKEEFAAHPEYFALVQGKRTPPQFCVSNPGLQKVILQHANTYFEKHPDFDMVSLDPADQGGWCTCAECAKLGPSSDQAFYLANIVAKDLQQTHPGKYVGLLAYSWHSDAPAFQLEPNVYVQLTAGMNASKYSFDELFKLWSEKCRHLGIYEYYSYWEMDKCMLPGTGILNDWDHLGPRMKRFVDNRVNSISGQSANCWGVNGLGHYLAAKLMWNASADVEALKKDFYAKAFGPAAPVLERYYERLNLAHEPPAGATLLRQCLADLEEATPLAAGRPDVLKRLDALKENLVYNQIGLKVETAADQTQQKARTLEWFTWAYRTRNNYMNDWITFRSAVGHPAAEKLGEPTWYWRNTTNNPEANPWRKDEPVTTAELEKRLGGMKAELGDLPTIPEQAYKGPYVLVKASGTGGTEQKQLFTGRAVYLLASIKGEPLRFSVTKRDTGPWEKPDAKYSLVSQDGQEIAAGGVPTGQHDLEFKVPGPGTYRFTCLRGGTGWDVAFPTTLPHAIAFERGADCRPAFIPRAWFYVPKATTEIVLYAAINSSVLVRAPGNRVAHKGSSDGRYLVLPVRAGEDGKLWSIQGKFRNLWLFNIPTVLSSSPEWIFVPKDLAQRDGLEVMREQAGTRTQSVGSNANSTVALRPYQSQSLSVEKATIGFRNYPGKSPPLVLIPGSWNGAAQWDLFLEHFDRHRQVIVVEMRGHGQSWPPPENGSIEQFARDTLAVMDHLGIDRFHVGGHSIGGMIAIELAGKQPQRVLSCLCAEGWAYYKAQHDAFPDASQNQLDQRQRQKAAEATATMRKRWTADQRQAFARIWTQWDGRPLLQATEVPVLQLYGDRGRPPATRAQLHLPDKENIQLRWIPGASHSDLPLARPQELAREFERFIRWVETEKPSLSRPTQATTQ